MKMYRAAASFWPLISDPADYAGEAGDAALRLRREARIPVRDVLELGSGGGNNASHLKRWFSMTLVDPSAGMRRVSRALNPECRHVAGDMRSVRLGRTFDGVFVHDAVMYMRTESDLRAAMATVAAHLRVGGAALVIPDHTRETFRPSTGKGGHDERLRGGGTGRSARYLEWTLPPASPQATENETHYALLLRARNGSVRAVHDVHREGLFPRATWLRILRDVGLVARRTSRVEEGVRCDVFVARKPAAPRTPRTTTADGP
ncbi:MAG: class I SAM-dependent methyltransferase [Thermoplasmata archaeon]|nr:class I SAM-dependent methyltransferase [Thermoplasmata archaeon]